MEKCSPFTDLVGMNGEKSCDVFGPIIIIHTVIISRDQVFISVVQVKKEASVRMRDSRLRKLTAI